MGILLEIDCISRSHYHWDAKNMGPPRSISRELLTHSSLGELLGL